MSDAKPVPVCRDRSGRWACKRGERRAGAESVKRSLYEYVSTGLTWSQAFAAASSSTYLGRQGYLATITSDEEQAFIVASVTTQNQGAWLGGSDAETEGTWKWVAGPEAGQVLGYSNWAPGEPNDFGGQEDWMIANWSGSSWNDLRDAGESYGYIVEYSAAVPEPGAWALMIGGFGLVGGALRSRRTAVAA